MEFHVSNYHSYLKMLNLENIPTQTHVNRETHYLLNSVIANLYMLHDHPLIISLPFIIHIHHLIFPQLHATLCYLKAMYL